MHVPHPPKGARAEAALFGLAIVLALSATGCVSRITGNEGNLVFSYVADDNFADFNKAIAVGAKLDLQVREAGTNEVVTLTAATSDDDKVLAVVSHSASALTVEGKGSGNALLEVSADKKDGGSVKDSVNLNVRVPTKMELSHYCTSDAAGYYLVNNKVLVPYELKLDSGAPVIGYGYQPVSITPAAAATLDQTGKNQQHLWLQLAGEAGKVTIASTIDSTKLELDVVAPALIDGAMLDGGAFAKQAFRGTKHLVLIRPTIGGKPICQANTEMTATSTTPDACTVKALTVANDSEGVVNAWGWVEIEGSKVAKCDFDVTFAKAADGKGVTTSFSVDVVALRRP